MFATAPHVEPGAGTLLLRSGVIGALLKIGIHGEVEATLLLSPNDGGALNDGMCCGKADSA